MISKSNKILCVVLGGGGHARVVIDALKCAGVAEPVAVLDIRSDLWGKEIFGIPIIGDEKQLPDLKKRGVTHFVPGVGGVKENAPRQKVFEEGLQQGLTPLTVIHPRAIVSQFCRISEGSVIVAGAIINAGAFIGRNVIINTGAIVDHDCVIEDHSHIAPGAALSGGVRVGVGGHIGTGAVVKQGITIGKEALVAAGSVVITDVAPGKTVKGVPAK